MNKFKAVLFDMDGVIVDTEPLHHKAYFKMFEDMGIDVSMEMYESFTGQATRRVCETLCSHFGLDNDPAELMQRKRAHFAELFTTDPDLDLITGVRGLIEHYHAQGLILILASSASMNTITRVFDRFELDQYFSGKISGADLVESKPNPEIFIRAAEMAKVSKDECFVIEDSTNGITAAHRAGIFCVAFKSPNSKNQDYRLANRLIEDFSQIYDGPI